MLCLSLFAAEPTTQSPADAAAWISQLTADDRAVRQMAMENLRKAGEPVRSLLEEAAKSDEKNRAVSAKWLLAVLKTAPTLDKANAALTATKPVKATVVVGVGEKDEKFVEIQIMGDGKHARLKMPWGSVVADGKIVWSVLDPALLGETDPKAQPIVMKRTLEDLIAEKPGSLNKLPGIVYLDAMRAAFDFTTIKEGNDGGTDVLFVEGWLKRPELLSQAAIMKAIREGDTDARQLMAFANIRGLARSRFTLEKNNFLLRKLEMQDRDAKVLNTCRFDYDYSPIPESTFTFVPPKDAQVIETSSAMIKGLLDEVKAFTEKHGAKPAENEKK